MTDPFSHPIFDDDDDFSFTSSPSSSSSYDAGSSYAAPSSYWSGTVFDTSMTSPFGTTYAPPTPPSFPSIASPAGRTSDLGQRIASQVQARIAGSRGPFSLSGPPRAPNVPNAADLGAAIRSRVQGAQRTPFAPSTGVSQPSLPTLPDLGAQIRSRISGRAPAPTLPSMPDMRAPTVPGAPTAPAAAAPPTPGQIAPPPQAPTAPGTVPAPAPAPAAPVPTGGGTLGAPQGQIPIGEITGGGDWNNVNQFDPIFEAAGAKHGVDPSFLKSMMIIESGGAQDAVGAGGAAGAMQIKSEVWGDDAAALGYDLNTVEGQIGMAAAILGNDTWNAGGSTPEEIFLSTYYPVYDEAGNLCLTCYGESGHTPQMYLNDIAMYQGEINGAAPAGGGTATAAAPTGEIAQQADGTITDGVTTVLPPGTVAGPVTPTQTGTASEMGNAIVDAAMEYVNEVPYILGAIPGADQDPRLTGWDCSGLIYHFDQKMGTGQIPMGSHFQYDWAVEQGLLNTDPSQLQEGDLVFFDTGADSGSMDNGNIRADGSRNPATHVGIYLGDGRILHAANPSEGTVVSSFADFADIFLGGARAW